MTSSTTVQYTWHAIDNGDGGSTIKDDHGGLVAFVQWRGNAPLVEAAPELLLALDTIVNHWTKGEVLTADAWQYATEVLAQARGESA